MVFARFMGTSWIADAFGLAFQLPNLMRRLLGEGALTAAFIPIFKEKEKLEGEQAMWHAANAVLSALVITTCLIVGVTMLGLTFALGAGAFTDKTRLMLELMRVMAPYVILVCVAAVLIGMLNARGHYFVPALGATMLNVVLIASVFLIAPWFGDRPERQIFGLAIGVLLAGVAQASFQLPALLKEGFRFQWVSPWQSPVVRQVIGRMIPGMLGVAAYQFNVVVTQGFGFWYGTGIVSSFEYAVRFMEVPQGVFGISLATYLLPTLSGMAAEKKFGEFRATLLEGLSHLMVLNLLASAMLLVQAEPIIRLFFEGKKFDAGATLDVSLTLSCMAPGLIAFSTVNILARAFFALGDTQTPMRISAVCLGVNVVLCFWLIAAFHAPGVAVANTLSSVCNVALLVYALRRKMPKLDFRPLLRVLFQLFTAAVFAGLLAWSLKRMWLLFIGHTTLVTKAGELFVPMALASAAYFAIAIWLKVPAALEMLELVRQRLSRKAKEKK
jgi:putative peptidoglycan lipid II flippase